MPLVIGTDVLRDNPTTLVMHRRRERLNFEALHACEIADICEPESMEHVLGPNYLIYSVCK